MAQFTIEIDDKGDLVGTAPAELDGIFKRIESTGHGAGYTKAQQEATEKLKAEIERVRTEEAARVRAEQPHLTEKLSRFESDNQALNKQVQDNAREYTKNLTAREEAHARVLTEQAERQKKLVTRIEASTRQVLKGMAKALGARDESMDELDIILAGSIGYTDEMEPFVKNPDGTTRSHLGKPMSIEAYVKDYLDTHPHHRKPAQGQGGGARGGASFQGHSHAVSFDAAKARIESGDRSAGAINEAFEALRKRA
jgi:23S rRNA pseudoU1915 N3-methylase RlmH